MRILKLLFFYIFLIGNSYGSGTTIGNAGDLLSKEIFHLSRELSSSISKVDTTDLPFNISNRIDELLPRLTLKFKKNLTLNGGEVTAINVPEESLLIVDPYKWRKLETRGSKRILLLHELLWLIGLDDSDYSYSTSLFEKVKAFEARLFQSPISQALTAALCEGILRGDNFTVFETLRMGANVVRHCPEKAFNGDGFPRGGRSHSLSGPMNLIIEMFNNRWYEYENREEKLFSYLRGILGTFPDFNYRSAKNLLEEIRVSSMEERLKFRLVELFIDYDYPIEKIQELLVMAFPHQPYVVKFWPPLSLFIKLSEKGVNWNRNIEGYYSIPGRLLALRSPEDIAFFYSKGLLDWCFFGRGGTDHRGYTKEDFALNFASKDNQAFLAEQGITSCSVEK